MPQDNSAINPEHCSVAPLGIPAGFWGAHPGRCNRGGQRQPMPIFDHSASRPGCAEAALLRSVLGPAKPSVSSFQRLSGGYRGRQRRASVKRALVVLALLGLFCGSATVMSEKPQPPSGAAPVRPPAAAQAPVRAHAKAKPALPIPGPVTEMVYCLWTEGPGEAPAVRRLVAEADTDAGALHARSC